MPCPHHFVRWRPQAISLAGSLLVIALSCLAQPKTGDVVFQTDFEGAGALRAWGAEQNQNVRLAPGFQSAQSLQVERQTNTTGPASVSLPLPIDKMRGARLACRAMVRADGVTPPPQPWNGIKFMLHITTPSGALWPQQNNLFGTFDWKLDQFTHQGVHGGATGIAYPGLIAGKLWDQAALRRVLQPVRDWQRDYGVQIYIGEFSAIRWAPNDSAYRYLKDCIALFEEFGWDWSYHAFREWSGWSVEHDQDQADTASSKTQTNREKLLRDWYGKNVKAK